MIVTVWRNFSQCEEESVVNRSKRKTDRDIILYVDIPNRDRVIKNVNMNSYFSVFYLSIEEFINRSKTSIYEINVSQGKWLYYLKNTLFIQF